MPFANCIGAATKVFIISGIGPKSNGVGSSVSSIGSTPSSEVSSTGLPVGSVPVAVAWLLNPAVGTSNGSTSTLMITTIFSPGFIIPVLSNISSPSSAGELVVPPPLKLVFKPPIVLAVPLTETPIALTNAGVN